MAMTTMKTKNKNNTKEELAAAASTLGKDVEEIADIIASLTRDLLLIWAVEVDINNVSVDQEEEGGGK